MVSKSDFKNLFQSSMKEMLTKKDKQAKKNTEGDDDSLDMNVFEKLMEGKHTMIVTKSNDDLKSINDTDTFDYSIQDKITHKNCEHNLYYNSVTITTSSCYFVVIAPSSSTSTSSTSTSSTSTSSSFSS
jgi:hypothetical protein